MPEQIRGQFTQATLHSAWPESWIAGPPSSWAQCLFTNYCVLRRDMMVGHAEAITNQSRESRRHTHCVTKRCDGQACRGNQNLEQETPDGTHTNEKRQPTAYYF